MPLTIEQQKALAIAQAKRKRAEAGGDAKPDPNASNPIITAQRQSQVKAGNDFAQKKDAERRYRDELAVMNAASPIPFKNTGPGGQLELNQERPDALGTRAVASSINTNIGAANTVGQVGLNTANAYGAALDPAMGGAVAAQEFYRGEGDAPERLATAATQGGYVRNQQAIGDVLPSLPIPAPTTAGEMGADVVGNLATIFTGFGGPILKGGKALSETLATVPGMSRTLRGVGVETGENAALAYGLSAGAAPAGSDRNMAGTRGAADPLSYVSIEAARAIPRGIKALEVPTTPTNAGGANLRQTAPQTPPVAAATQTAQQAPQPSVTPVTPAPQARATGAGQQPPVSPPTLNAVPTTPAVPKQQMLVARDTAKILTRIMRAANVKNADIRGYLPGAVQRYKSLNDSRVPFAFFLESDLPKHFAEPVAADVVTKLQGWGRARNAAMGTGDKSAQITQGTIKELRGSQQDFLTKSAEANLYKGSLISQEDQILKSLRETGRKGYEPSLDYARQAIDGRRTPSAAEAQAIEDLKQILARPTLQKYVDDATRIRAEKDGIDIDQLIKDDPIGSAHWLQSEFRRLSDASEDALTGKPTRTSGAYDDLREMILDPLKRASPGYEGAMMRFGHDFGSKEAVTFGKGIFTASRGAYDTAQKIRKFKKLGRRQQTVAWKSVRDEFLNEFRGTPEDAAAKLTRMQQEGALDLLEQMGARGKRFADDIRRIAQQENPSIRAIEQASNSLTFKNLSGAEAAREMVQSPINQVVGSVTDKASWPMTLAADAVVMGTTGIPVPMLTASKAMDRFGNPGPKTLSRATEGLYGLPSKASGSTPELLKASRGGGGGRPKGGAPQVEQDIGALLKALDEVEADPKRRGGPEGKRLLNQIAAAQGGKPAKPKRQKVAAAPATGLGTSSPAAPTAKPGQTSQASPTVTGALVGGGLGYVGSDGDPVATLAGATGLGAASGLGAKLMKGGKPKAAPAKPAFDQRFMKEAQRLVSYNGGVDKALKAQQYVIDQLKNSKAVNAQDRLNRAVSIQYAIRRMAERSNRELDEIVPMAEAAPTGPKPIDPNTNYNIDPRGDKFVIRTDAGEEVLGAPQFADRKRALAWLQGETRKARQGATPIPGERPIKPPKRNGMTNMVAGGALGGTLGALGSGEADAQTTETAQKIADNKAQTDAILADIARIENDMRVYEGGDPLEMQKTLNRRSTDGSFIQEDGSVGPETTAAIARDKTAAMAALKDKRQRLTELETAGKELQEQAAFERTRPTDEQQAFRDYAPLLGGIAGATGAKLLRVGGTTVSKFTAKSAIKKADALLNNAPISPPKTVQDRAEIRKRATNVNEFWQRGGSKTKVPFETKRDGTWTARPPKDVTPPSALFPDKFIGRKVGPMDALIGGSAATEAVLAGQNAEVIKEKLAVARETAQDDPSEKNLARVQELEDQYAQAKGLMMLGIGAGIGTGIGVLTSKYASKRANVPKAEEELAILREYFANQKKTAAKPSGGKKKTSSNPPLPPSRPRRNQRPPNP